MSCPFANPANGKKMFIPTFQTSAAVYQLIKKSISYLPPELHLKMFPHPCCYLVSSAATAHYKSKTMGEIVS